MLIKIKKCFICERTFTVKSYRVATCSVACRKERRARITRAWILEHKKKKSILELGCKSCGTKLKSIKYRMSYCSDSCAKSHKRLYDRIRWAQMRDRVWKYKTSEVRYINGR